MDFDELINGFNKEQNEKRMQQVREKREAEARRREYEMKQRTAEGRHEASQIIDKINEYVNAINSDNGTIYNINGIDYLFSNSCFQRAKIYSMFCKKSKELSHTIYKEAMYCFKDIEGFFEKYAPCIKYALISLAEYSYDLLVKFNATSEEKEDFVEKYTEELIDIDDFLEPYSEMLRDIMQLEETVYYSQTENLEPQISFSVSDMIRSKVMYPSTELKRMIATDALDFSMNTLQGLSEVVKNNIKKQAANRKTNSIIAKMSALAENETERNIDIWATSFASFVIRVIEKKGFISDGQEEHEVVDAFLSYVKDKSSENASRAEEILVNMLPKLLVLAPDYTDLMAKMILDDLSKKEIFVLESASEKIGNLCSYRVYLNDILNKKAKCLEDIPKMNAEKAACVLEQFYGFKSTTNLYHGTRILIDKYTDTIRTKNTQYIIKMGEEKFKKSIVKAQKVEAMRKLVVFVAIYKACYSCINRNMDIMNVERINEYEYRLKMYPENARYSDFVRTKDFTDFVFLYDSYEKCLITSSKIYLGTNVYDMDEVVELVSYGSGKFEIITKNESVYFDGERQNDGIICALNAALLIYRGITQKNYMSLTNVSICGNCKSHNIQNVKEKKRIVEKCMDCGNDGVGWGDRWKIYYHSAGYTLDIIKKSLLKMPWMYESGLLNREKEILQMFGYSGDVLAEVESHLVVKEMEQNNLRKERIRDFVNILAYLSQNKEQRNADIESESISSEGIHNKETTKCNTNDIGPTQEQIIDVRNTEQAQVQTIGIKNTEQAQVQTTEIREENIEMMFCPSCGKKIISTSKFCKFCGEKNPYIE